MYFTPLAAKPGRDLDSRAPGVITRCLLGATLELNRHRSAAIIPMQLTNWLEALFLIFSQRTIQGKNRHD